MADIAHRCSGSPSSPTSCQTCAGGAAFAAVVQLDLSPTRIIVESGLLSVILTCVQDNLAKATDSQEPSRSPVADHCAAAWDRVRPNRH